MIDQIRQYHQVKQHLLDKKSISSYHELIKDHIGLHSTDYLTPYFSLWARIKDFEPRQLFDDLNSLILIRRPTFRGAVHIIHKDNFRMINEALTYFRIGWGKGLNNYIKKEKIDFDKYREDIRAIFDKKEILTIYDIKKRLDAKWSKEWIALSTKYLEIDGTLLRTTSRYLLDNTKKYGLLDDWLPEIAKESISEDDALARIFEKYLRIFGPVTIEDFSWWLPLTKTKTKEFIAKFEKDLTSFDFNNKEYYLFKDDYRSFQNSTIKTDENRIFFLPYEDHFVKAYTDRTWFLSEAIDSRLQNPGQLFLGQVRPSIWLNGEIIGRWEYSWANTKKTAMKIEVTFIEESRKTPKVIAEIENKRKEIEDFANQKLVPLTKAQITQ